MSWESSTTIVANILGILTWFIGAIATFIKMKKSDKFLNLVNTFIPIIPQPQNKENPLSEESSSSRDNTRYCFVDFENKESDNSGKGWSKGRLVWQIVYDYIRRHPNITFNELANVFNGVAKDIDTVFKEDDLNREKDYIRKNYFKEAIDLPDGNKIVVYNGWRATGIWANFEPFLKYCSEKLNYEIKPFQKGATK